MLRKVTHCAGRVSANTRPHQLRWHACSLVHSTSLFSGYRLLAVTVLQGDQRLPLALLQQMFWSLLRDHKQ